MLNNPFKKLFSLPSFLLGIMFTALIITAAWAVALKLRPQQNKMSMSQQQPGLTIIKPAQAEEIYDEFICSCCGRPLDPANICCGDMQAKIDFVNQQVKTGLNREAIILAGVKRFGFNSLAKDDTKEEIKAQLAAQAPLDAAKISFIGKKNFNFGTIGQSDGVVFTTFEFTNQGQSDLIIDKLSTSCGCTLAAIVYQGQEGPTFTMPGHGKDNPQNWSVAIKPGDTAQVKVYYDPNAHGQQQEPSLAITRTISIFSNDPVDFEQQLRIDLEQIP
jgi:hypothetical protein